MSWSKVQDTVVSGFTTGVSGTAAYGANVTAGNLLVVMFAMNSAAASTFTIGDTQSLTWTAMYSEQFDGSTVQTQKAWAAVAGSSAALTVNLGWSVADSNGGDVVLTEWSGFGGSITEDGTAQIATPSAASGATPVTTPTYTPTVTGDLVINFITVSAGVTAVAGSFTQGDVNLAETGAGWGWTTGALSTLTPSATVNNSYTAQSVIFGIEVGGSSATLNVYRIN